MRFCSTLVVMATAAAITGCSGDNTTEPGARINRLVITPDTLTIDPQQRVTFLAYGETSGRDSVGVNVAWSASGGAITPNGVYTAAADTGYYQVVASDPDGHNVVARVRTMRLLRQVVLMPAAASVIVGGAFQFRNYGLNRFGDSIATAVTYQATGGTINAAGLYTAGSSAGTYRVIATHQAGPADTSTVTVTTAPPPPPAGIASVEVAPGSTTMDPGTTFQFRATARDAAGNALTGRTFTWSSSSTSTATVDATGLVQAVGAGAVTITVTSEGKTGTAQVSISVPPVATVTVSPSSVNLTQGGTQALTVVLRDAAGNALTGRSVTWTSSSMSVATVNAFGTVSAAGTGAATITATSEGKTGSSSVTVASNTTAECSNPNPQWIWCDDFEQNRTASYFEYDNAGGNFLRSGGVGYNGSTAMRAHWNAGALGAGALHVAFGRTPSSYFRAVDAGTANYREVYWRLYIKHQAGWVGGGADKLTRAMVFAGANFSQAAIGHVWSGTSGSADGNYLMVDPARGTDALGNLVTTGYNDFGHLSWLGATRGSTPIFDGSHVGQWYCVEAHMKLNTAGSSDGVLEMWVDGALQAQRTGLNFVGSYSQYGINAIYLENYWNAGSAVAQDRYLDNVVVSTARVGC